MFNGNRFMILHSLLQFCCLWLLCNAYGLLVIIVFIIIVVVVVTVLYHKQTQQYQQQHILRYHRQCRNHSSLSSHLHIQVQTK